MGQSVVEDTESDEGTLLASDSQVKLEAPSFLETTMETMGPRRTSSAHMNFVRK